MCRYSPWYKLQTYNVCSSSVFHLYAFQKRKPSKQVFAQPFTLIVPVVMYLHPLSCPQILVLSVHIKNLGIFKGVLLQTTDNQNLR